MFDGDGNRKYLTRTERTAFYKQTMMGDDVSARTLCLTLLYTGCRISECLGLTPQRIDIQAKAVVFETLKQRVRGNFRSVPIPDNLISQFQSLLAGLPATDPIWTLSRTTAFRAVKEMMRRAGIKGAMACPKGLRHGFAVACVSQNVPLPTVKKWLGHARLETTAIYLDAVGDEEREFAKRLWEIET